MSLADPVCHQIPCNTRSREVTFRIKIKCSRQFSVFSLHCKLWRITSLSDIITYSGTILDLTSVLHSYSTVLDTTSVWDQSARSQPPQAKPTWPCSIFSPLASVTTPFQMQLALFHFGPLHPSLVLLEKKKALDAWACIHTRYFASFSKLPPKKPWGHWLCFHCTNLFGQSGFAPFSSLACFYRTHWPGSILVPVLFL